MVREDLMFRKEGLAASLSNESSPSMKDLAASLSNERSPSIEDLASRNNDNEPTADDDSP